MRKSLNDRQAALLQRIADGTRPVTSREPDVALTAYALHNRRLVSLHRANGIWTAQLTDEGRYYLEQGQYKPAPVEAPSSRSTGGRRGDLAVTAADLVKRLLEADGTLTVSNPDAATRAAWRRAIHRALNDSLVPAGKQLRHTGRDRGDLVLSLVDETEVKPKPAVLAPIAVPERLVRPHRLITATREAVRAQDAKWGKSWIDTTGSAGVFHLRVSRPQLGRALLLLQALVDEAVHRGYDIGSMGLAGGAGIQVRGHATALVLVEETDRIPHQLTATERTRAARESWYRPPEFDQVASGRLRLRLSRAEYGRTSSWADRQRWKLDDRLPHVLAAIEQAAAEAEARENERQRQLEVRRCAWEAAMQKARARLQADRRRDILGQQLADWRLAVDIRAYCAALRAVPAEEGRDARSTWITWAESYADAVDPLHRTDLMPADREPTPAELQPYLPRGFSASGPDSYWTPGVTPASWR